jgi:RNA recognition motif-containing protein
MNPRSSRSMSLDPTPRPPNGTYVVFVGNIPCSANEADVARAFKPFGALASVRLGRWHGGVSRGCAFVEFHQVESADQAVRFNLKVEINGRRVRIDYDHPTPVEDRW